jgi:hypothetical protein
MGDSPRKLLNIYEHILGLPISRNAHPDIPNWSSVTFIIPGYMTAGWLNPHVTYIWVNYSDLTATSLQSYNMLKGNDWIKQTSRYILTPAPLSGSNQQTNEKATDT